MARKPIRKIKAKHRYKALAFLNRGMKVGAVVRELQKRYHPGVPLADVRKAYFPRTGIFALSRLESASRQEILSKMDQMSAHRDNMKKLNRNFEFANARNARLRELNQDPDFVKARNNMAVVTIRRLNQAPEFAGARAKRNKKSRERLLVSNKDPAFIEKRNRAASERMKRMNRDPKFKMKVLEGIARRWNTYRLRLAKLSKEMNIDGIAWDYGERVPITKKTPETEFLLKERITAINEALNNLTARQREVVGVIFFSNQERNLTIANAASILNKSEKTVSFILTQALVKLSKNKKLAELR